MGGAIGAMGGMAMAAAYAGGDGRRMTPAQCARFKPQVDKQYAQGDQCALRELIAPAPRAAAGAAAAAASGAAASGAGGAAAGPALEQQVATALQTYVASHPGEERGAVIFEELRQKHGWAPQAKDIFRGCWQSLRASPTYDCWRASAGVEAGPLPRCWEMGKHGLCTVPDSGDEWRHLCALFFRTLTGAGGAYAAYAARLGRQVYVMSISRVQNEAAYRRYWRRSHADKPVNEPAKELMMFHGCRSQGNENSIVTKGFEARTRSGVLGTWLAYIAAYSDAGFAFDDREGCGTCSSWQPQSVTCVWRTHRR